MIVRKRREEGEVDTGERQRGKERKRERGKERETRMGCDGGGSSGSVIVETVSLYQWRWR